MDEVPAGTTIAGKYLIEEKIKSGGMGTVYRCRRIEDGAAVALKFCRPENDQAQRRFAREVRLMMAVSHPNVVPILDAAPDNNPPYLVMPFADGSVAGKAGVLAGDEDLALATFLDLCRGVQALHSGGVVHRDIKPDNGLIWQGRVMIADLGLAKLNERDSTVLTHHFAVVGTEAYLAPEQRMPGGSIHADNRTDIYQLGKTLYQLLTGLNPMLPDYSKINPGLALIVRRATREVQDERYQSVGQIIDAIESYKQAKDPQANPLGAFEAVIAQVTERLARGEYKEEEVKQLMRILMAGSVLGDHSVFLQLFDRVPEQILGVMAEQFEQEFLPIVQAYVGALDDLVSGMDFAYAERVATRMRSVFEPRRRGAELNAGALEAVLLAGVRLNRFAAMDAFDSMLAAVSDNGVAGVVAEMLHKREDEYSRMLGRVPGGRLHPTIRAVESVIKKPAQ